MKKIFVALSITIVVIILLISALYIVVYNKAQKEPDNNPSYYLEEVKPSSENQVLVCIGDSITHGRVSDNYVEILSERLSDRGIDIVNAGINGEFAYNVLMRIDEVIMCDPDYITILIGTNDAYGSLSEENGMRMMKEMALDDGQETIPDVEPTPEEHVVLREIEKHVAPGNGDRLRWAAYIREKGSDAVALALKRFVQLQDDKQRPGQELTVWALDALVATARTPASKGGSPVAVIRK